MNDIKMKLTPADLEVIGDALTGYGADKRLIMKFSFLETIGGVVSMTCDESEDTPAKQEVVTGIQVRPIEIDSKILMMGVPSPEQVVEKTPVNDGPLMEIEIGAKRVVDDGPVMELEIGVKSDPDPIDRDNIGPKSGNTADTGWDSRIPRPTKMESLTPMDATPTPVVVEDTPCQLTEVNVEPTPEMMAEANKLAEEMVQDEYPHPIRNRRTLPRNPNGKPEKVVEPDFDTSESCGECGGFLSVNPHSDVKMNCSCGKDPYTIKAEPTPEPQPEPAQHGAAWTTGPADTVWKT